jgi:hypothetical protein
VEWTVCFTHKAQPARRSRLHGGCYARLISVGTFTTPAHAIDWAAWRLIPSTSQLEMFGELSISTQSGLKIAGAVSSRAACSPTAVTPPPSETEADDAVFPSLEASYCHLRPIFQVRASGELAWRSTRKGAVRGGEWGPVGDKSPIHPLTKVSPG